MTGWERCQRLKLEHTDKLYIHKPESVQENETHEILWDYEIEKNHSILTKRPNLISINKKKRIVHLEELAVPADHKGKIKESVMIKKYLDLARELKKLWNMKVTVIPIVVDALGTTPKSLERRLEELEIRG